MGGTGEAPRNTHSWQGVVRLLCARSSRHKSGSVGGVALRMIENATRREGTDMPESNIWILRGPDKTSFD